MGGRNKEQTVRDKKALIDSLEKALGVVSTACKLVKTSRETFYKWKNTDPDFKEAVEDIQDIALDFVESQLFKNIQGGSDTAAIFYHKTAYQNS